MAYKNTDFQQSLFHAGYLYIKMPPECGDHKISKDRIRRNEDEKNAIKRNLQTNNYDDNELSLKQIPNFRGEK